MDEILTQRYLNVRVSPSAPAQKLHLAIEGGPAYGFEAALAPEGQGHWMALDLSHFGDRRLRVTRADRHAPEGSAVPLAGALVLADAIPDAGDLYREALRPQYHFSARRGWNNDPNGLLYYRGRYHLFFQHNPFGTRWGNMHWGHAVSRDLLHWEEQPIALFPDAAGTMYSGSGVVDWQHTLGVREGSETPLVLAYTAAGDPFTQNLAYSTDGGTRWTKHPANPVLGHVAGRNRDPKVIWHAPTERWIMALYLEGPDYALYASPDLKAWTHLQTLTVGEGTECPDLFELAVDGDAGDTRWVLWAANGAYQLGSFDGSTFEPDGDPLRFHWGGQAYAAQTWSDIPPADGRRIQIAWFRVPELAGMPFNQFMTFPTTLTLRRTPAGVRLHAEPVEEIRALCEREQTWRGLRIGEGDNPLAGLEGALLDVEVEFSLGSALIFGLQLGEVELYYDVGQGALFCQERMLPFAPQSGHVHLRALLDRSSIEVYGGHGEVALPLALPQGAGAPTPLALFARGGNVMVEQLAVRHLRSIWQER